MVVDEFKKYDNQNLELKFMYDAILKIMKKSNVITLPYKVFKQMYVTIKSKALERNSSYTKYTQIAVVKSDQSQLEGVLVMMEVDEENPVKLSILNEYGIQHIETYDIQKYENAYRQWRRERSYMF